jgi:hypothetical protein
MTEEDIAEAYALGQKDEREKNKFSLRLLRGITAFQVLVMALLLWTNQKLNETVKQLFSYLKADPEIVQMEKRTEELRREVAVMEKVCQSATAK